MADGRFAPRLPTLVAALLMTAGLLAGCASPTPYQARGSDGLGPRYGYAEQKLADDRYRVSASGNEDTSQETVENYLLFRSAELTLDDGYRAFRVVQRDIEPTTRYVTTYLGGPRRPIGYAFVPGPFYDPRYRGWPSDAYSRPLTRYRAYAEIQLLDHLPPEKAPELYEARPLLTQLAPAINRPGSLAN